MNKKYKYTDYISESIDSLNTILKHDTYDWTKEYAPTYISCTIKLLQSALYYIEGTKILTLEQAKAQGLYVFSYNNGAYEYKTKDNLWHLIRRGVDLLEGKEAISCCSYDNGDYKYQTKDKLWHLIIDGVDVLDGKEAIYCHSYDSGAYEYKTKDGEKHYITSK